MNRRLPPPPAERALAQGPPAVRRRAQMPCAIDGADELVAWLRLLEQRAVAVKLAGQRGAGIATTISAVDAERGRLAFEAVAQPEALADLVAGDELSAFVSLDEAMLHFDVQAPTLVRGEGWFALEAALPACLYRLQRREAFRVRSLPSTTAAEFRHPGWPEMRLVLRVLDLSAQGCALLLPDDVPPIAAGIEIGGVCLRLDALTRLETRLRVLHLTSIRPGAAGVRLGCEIDGLLPDTAHALQRWVDRLQRRRRPFGG